MKKHIFTFILGTILCAAAVPAQAMDMDGGMYQDYTPETFSQATEWKGLNSAMADDFMGGDTMMKQNNNAADLG